MNREQLQELLNNTLLGKELDLRKYFNRTGYDVCNALKPHVSNKVGMLLDSDYDNRYITIRYKGYGLFVIHIQTTREYKYERYSGRNYTYIIQSVAIVGDYFTDLESKIAEIDEKERQSKIAKENKQQEMLGVFIKLKQHFGDSLWSVVRYLNDHYFELNELSKGE